MTLHVPFQQIDVFTDTPFKGNPVAVILDGNELSSEKMQQIANWTNLSETTFVCKPSHPKADYRLRIFTPNNELPFAGHPTLGSAFATLKHGLKPKNPGHLVQETEIGLVDIVIEGTQLFLTLPDSSEAPINDIDLEKLAGALGITSSDIKVSRTFDMGAIWMTLQLADAEVVQRLNPDMEKLAAVTSGSATGVTVFGSKPAEADAAFEVRSFAPSEGVMEDPVCGSGNGCVATMIKQLGLIDDESYVASQGASLGRNGRVEVKFQEDGSILLGGHSVTCIEGQLTI